MISEMPGITVPVLLRHTYQILPHVLFQQSLYILLLIHRIFYLLVYICDGTLCRTYRNVTWVLIFRSHLVNMQRKLWICNVSSKRQSSQEAVSRFDSQTARDTPFLMPCSRPVAACSPNTTENYAISNSHGHGRGWKRLVRFNLREEDPSGD